MTQLTLIKVPASQAQIKYVKSLRVSRGLPLQGADELSKSDASKEIDKLRAMPAATPTADEKAPSTGGAVPLSNYALRGEDGTVRFYRVAQWKGTRYLRQLIGHPGAWQKIKLAYPAQALVMARLAADPLAAAQLYAATYTVCAVCSSPLSDEVSRERGIGPICSKRFGF